MPRNCFRVHIARLLLLSFLITYVFPMFSIKRKVHSVGSIFLVKYGKMSIFMQNACIIFGIFLFILIYMCYSDYAHMLEFSCLFSRMTGFYEFSCLFFSVGTVDLKNVNGARSVPFSSIPLFAFIYLSFVIDRENENK